MLTENSMPLYVWTFVVAGAVKDGDGIIGGKRTRVKVVKNKVAAPFKQTDFQITCMAKVFQRRAGYDLGVKCKLIDKSRWQYAYKGEKIGQVKPACMKYPRERCCCREEIERNTA